MVAKEWGDFLAFPFFFAFFAPFAVKNLTASLNSGLT